ncbi:MAG: GLUG motif-containing protein [Planctomycetota bacterium]|jgi:hypothetical protein
MRKGKSILILAVLVLCLARSAPGKYGGGSGTAGLPYLIDTPEQMNEIGANPDDWSRYFKLTADIDLSGFDGKGGRPAFNIIGYYINGGSSRAFTGNFDGNGHAISNFIYDSNHGNNTVGLFGYVNSAGAMIRNLTLSSVDVNSTTWLGTGALVGEMFDGNVDNCSVLAGTVSAESSAGGLVGFTWYGLITNCNSEVTVSAEWAAGGLVGGNAFADVSDCTSSCVVTGETEIGGLIGDNSGGVTNCRSSGSVNATVRSAGGLIGSSSDVVEKCCSTAGVTGDDEIGGLIGRNLAEISDCYARGSAYGNSEVGGLVGLFWNVPSENGVISNSYSATSTNGGGLIGYNIDGVVNASFWDNQASGTGWSHGGTGKTTDDMKTKSTFTNAGWDFADETANGTEDIWDICEETNYPRLVWQIPPADFVCPDGVDFRDFSVFASYWLKETK